MCIEYSLGDLVALADAEGPRLHVGGQPSPVDLRLCEVAPVAGDEEGFLGPFGNWPAGVRCFVGYEGGG